MNREKRQRYRRRFSFCRGIYLSYFLLVCLLVLVFFCYNYINTRKTLVENAQLSLSASHRQTVTVVQQKLEMLFNLNNQLYVSPEFTSMYPKVNEDKRKNAADIEMYFDARRSFKNTAQFNTDSMIRVYLHDNVLFANERVIFWPISDIDESDWFIRLQQSRNRQMWCYDTTGSEPVFAYVRLVYHGELPFVIYSGLPESALEKHMVNAYGEQGGITILYNETNSFAVPQAPEMMGEDRARIAEALTREEPYIEIFGQRYMFSDGAISFGDWRILSLLPEAAVVSDHSRLLLPSVLFMGACFVASLIIAILLGNIFVRRIRTLISHMENINPEGVSELIEVTGSNEISLIEEKFNGMILRLRSLIAEINATNDNKRKAELRALQAQINPHFLYNTLDTINWLAIEADELRISEMVTSLGHFYRLSLSDGRDIVSVEDELQIAKEYVYLQHMRHEKSLKIDFEVDDTCLQYRCVKLLIQPLIENAVKHGMRAEPGFRLQIRVRVQSVDQNRMGLWVENNGKLLSDGNEGSSDGIGRTGYGLENVSSRLKLNFGDDAFIQIGNNEEASGVVVYAEWSTQLTENT